MAEGIISISVTVQKDSDAEHILPEIERVELMLHGAVPIMVLRGMRVVSQAETDGRVVFTLSQHSQ